MEETKIINGKEYTWENISVHIKGVEIKNIVTLLYESKPIEINGLNYSFSNLGFRVHKDQRIYGKHPKLTPKKQIRKLVKRIKNG